MDNFRERFEALEQQTEQLKHETQALKAHTRTVERRLRWWRGFACGVVLLALISRSLQSGTAADTQPGGMAERMAALEKKFSAMTFDDAANEVVITGANLRIVNGLGQTTTTNGLGNLIVGYNELLGDGFTDTRTGSHNVVVGKFNNFSSFGGLVVGTVNEISGPFASVSGGQRNTASGFSASVSGGRDNTASAQSASVSGGEANTASGLVASVSGGTSNTASDNATSVSGGLGNTASGSTTSVSGRQHNTASAQSASVSGGEANTASGIVASVSGGANRTAPDTDNWAAGALFSDH